MTFIYILYILVSCGPGCVNIEAFKFETKTQCEAKLVETTTMTSYCEGAID